jgi:hypothetical protein
VNFRLTKDAIVIIVEIRMEATIYENSYKPYYSQRLTGIAVPPGTDSPLSVSPLSRH